MGYLRENNSDVFNSKQSSNLQGIIDYFSAPNLLDTFNLGGDFNYDNSQFQFLHNLPALTDLVTSNTDYSGTGFKCTLIDYRALMDTDIISAPLNNYINDILLITPTYNDISMLTEFFP